MNLSTPGDRRPPETLVPQTARGLPAAAGPSPAKPAAPCGSRPGRWLKVLLVTIVVPVLGCVVSDLLKPLVFPPEGAPGSRPPAGARPRERPSPPTLLREQERLERDIDRLLERLGEALPSAAIDRIRQLRSVLGDARLLEDLPDWLQEGDPQVTLPPALETERHGLLNRWMVLQQQVAELPPPTGG